MATTTNYSWETPDDTDLVKDGAAAIRTLGSSIDTTTKALNPSTTLGDIEYRSSTANTNTRLGIGSTGQVLTVAGGVPSWATPAGGSFVGVLCKKGASQTISNTTDTVLNFSGSDHYDTDGFHDPVTNNSRITIPAGLGGYYMVYGLNTWDVNATGRRFCELKKNGTKIFTSNGFAPNSSAAPSNMISLVLNLSAGDYVEYQVWQSSGGNLDTFGNDELTWFGVAKL